MSRAYTVGPRSQTRTTGRGLRVNPQKKPTSTRSDTGNTTQEEPKLLRASAETSSSTTCTSSKSKSWTSVTHSKLGASGIPPKPKVVTLADFNSGKNKSRPPNPKSKSVSSRQPDVRKNCQTSRTKSTGKNAKMWDDALSSTSSNPASNPQGGSGYYGNRSSAISGVNASGSNQTNVASNAQSTGDGEKRETSQGSYTRVTPDAKKRVQLQNQRTSELERLEAYKEKRKIGHVSMTPSRVGGARVSETDARKQQQKEQMERKYEMIRKREQWATEKREREDQEYSEKKTRARQQTEQNKQREQQRQREQQVERQEWIARGGLERLEGSGVGGAMEGAVEFEIDENDVESLREIFPFKDPVKLRRMLAAAKGDVNTVIDWLSD